MKDEELKEMFKVCKTVAVVGISPKDDRPSYRVATYLQSKGLSHHTDPAGWRYNPPRKSLPYTVGDPKRDQD